jgi:quercetin dioxygenase-like cupin family protein
VKIIRKKFIGGWFIGNFTPSVFKTNEFEVCYKIHEAGEKWPAHYHKIAVEINYLMRGKMTIQGKELIAGDVFIIDKNEVVDPTFQEKCELIVVKVPYAPNDKYNL